MDRFTKTCLGLIILLLGLIALRPAFDPAPVRAAQHQYEVVRFQDFGVPIPTNAGINNTLRSEAANGWELVSVVPIAGEPEPGAMGGHTMQLLLVFQR